MLILARVKFVFISHNLVKDRIWSFDTLPETNDRAAVVADDSRVSLLSLSLQGLSFLYISIED